jgi:hypothetical protein
VLKTVAKLNRESLDLAGKAQSKSNEVEAMGEKAVKVPAFLQSDPILP